MYAMILAGGLGERLRPLTDNLPKPMVPLNGKPILEHQIEWLKAGGVTGVIFLAGYRWEAIKAHFGNGRDFGVDIKYSVETSPLGRGGAIKQGSPLLPPDDEPAVVALNGDIITEQPLDALIAAHRERLAAHPPHLATLLVAPMISPYGLVDLDESGGVIGFREKAELPHWINGGVYVFQRDIFEQFPAKGDHEVETFPHLAAAGRIAAHQTRAFWTSIDSLKDLRQAEERLQAA